MWLVVHSALVWEAGRRWTQDGVVLLPTCSQKNPLATSGGAPYWWAGRKPEVDSMIAQCVCAPLLTPLAHSLGSTPWSLVE